MPKSVIDGGARMSYDGAAAHPHEPPAMAAGNFHDHKTVEGHHFAEEPAVMFDDPADDTADAGIDKISELPDDVLLDILGRLFTAGDVRTAARTSILFFSGGGTCRGRRSPRSP